MRALLSLLAAGWVGASALRAQIPPGTTIDADGPADFSSTDTETTAIFRQHVVVTGNGIKLTCDYLKVISTRKGDPTATLGQYGSFKYMLATGHVDILQGDREATGGRAEAFPAEDKLVLTENPTVIYLDTKPPFTTSGDRITLYRGERRATVEGPTHMTGPPMKDLGFGQPGGGAPAAGPPPAGTDAK
jgi:lipopolysaccharide export system protein LptA